MISGLLQAGFGIGQAIKNNKLRKMREAELEREVKGMPEYQIDPTAQGIYATAQSEQNAIDPAITQLYQNAMLNASNVAAAGQRNAGSGAEAINAAIAGQTNANQMLPEIAQLQTRLKQQRFGNLMNAQGILNAENQRKFSSQVAKNDAMQNLRTMQFANAQKLWQDSIGNIVGGVGAVESGMSDAKDKILSLLSPKK